MPDHPSNQPTPARPPAGPLTPLRSPNYWLTAAAGLALVGFGLYLVITRGGRSPTGFLIMCVGAAITPWLVIGLLGGLGLLGVGGYLAFKALGPIDYIYAGIAFVFGFLTINERIRTLRRTDRTPQP